MFSLVSCGFIRPWSMTNAYCSGNLHLGHHISDEEVLMGRRIWVGGGFFSCGGGGVKDETTG
jgi:hypothetical protein